MVRVSALLSAVFAAVATAAPAQEVEYYSTHTPSTSSHRTSTSSTSSHRTSISSTSSHQTSTSSTKRTTVATTTVKATTTKVSTTTTHTSQPTCTSYNANFDDITIVLPGTSLQPVGNYDGIAFNGIDVINIKNGVTGVIAQSSPNVGVIYLVSTLTTPANMTVNKPNTYFNLSSFYIGCVLSTQETLASAPTACTVILSGYKNGVETVTQTITYTPSNLLLAPMTKVTPNGFTNVDTIIYTQSSTTSAAVSVLLDNYVYSTCH